MSSRGRSIIYSWRENNQIPDVPVTPSTHEERRERRAGGERENKRENKGEIAGE